LRLVPGATWQQAAAQISHLRKPYFDEIANKYKGRAWFYAVPLGRSVGNEDERTPVLVLMLAVSFILLIACANLAGLTLVRISRRTAEIATRLALGATRWAILRQLWAENLLLALLGAGMGLALALLILKSLSGFLPSEFIPLGGLGIDIRVLAFTFAVSLFASLLFGALPALQTRRVDLRSSTAMGGRSVTRSSGLLRQALIASEVALTVVLLAGAGLLIRTLVYLETQPPGFDATNVMTAKVSLDDARYRDANAFHTLLERSVAAMRHIPGVEDATVGLSVPYERGLNDNGKIMDGGFAGREWASSLAYITPGYFDTLRIPILAGRSLAESDTATSEGVVVVNADFALKMFGERDPVGRHFQTEGRTYRVVGVCGNVAKRPGIQADAPMKTEPVFYVPATQTSQGLVNTAHVWFQPSWIVRTRKPIAGIAGAMQKALAQVDPSLPFSGFYSMNDILAENLIYQRAEVLLLGVLAGLALLLSAVGIYGLVSNLVVQRTREIGIRIALGAQMRQVMMEVGRSGVVASAVGLIVGMALAYFAVRVLQSQLYGVRTDDPATLTVVPFILAVIALAASFLPTLRIARIDPAKTLRME
jgi:predicted permease